MATQALLALVLQALPAAQGVVLAAPAPTPAPRLGPGSPGPPGSAAADAAAVAEELGAAGLLRQAERDDRILTLPGGDLSRMSAISARLLPIDVEPADEEVHDIAGELLTPVTVTFVLCMLVASWASSNRFARYFPESATIIFVAAFMGGLLRYGTTITYWIRQDHFDYVCASVLNLGLLPLIMFNSGWQLDRAHFMSEFENVLNFAVLGTVLTTGLIAAGSWQLGQLGLHSITSWRANVAFACLISSVDPVATIATYTRLQVPRRQPLLHTMVFGEAAINDAVAITLFTVVNVGDKESVWLAMGSSLFGSILFGAVMASCLIFLMRCASMAGRARPLTLGIIGSAYLVFAVAEAIGLSGIIANLFAGIVFRRFGACLLTEHDECRSTEVFELLGGLAESLVFVLVGGIASIMTTAQGALFGLCAFVLCLFARGAIVPFCAALSNMCKKCMAYREERSPTDLITWKHQVMMWVGGLRGGVSMVLALELNTSWCPLKDKVTIIEGTFLAIVLLLIVCAGSTEPLLDALGMIPSRPCKGDPLDAEEPADEGAAAAEQEQGEASSSGRRGSIDSVRSEKELRERREPCTLSQRQWGKKLVEFFEPIVLGDKQELAEMVAAGNRMEGPMP